MSNPNIKTLFSIAAMGAAVLGIIGLLTEAACVSSAVAKGIENSLSWAAAKVFALTP